MSKALSGVKPLSQRLDSSDYIIASRDGGLDVTATLATETNRTANNVSSIS